MKPIFKFIIIFSIIVVYIISINLFASLINFSSQQQSVSIFGGGLSVRLGFSDSVSVSVIRAPKWYGRFYVNNGNEVLNLFYLVKIPWKIQSYNFMIFHLIFLVTLILFIILIFTKKKVYKEETPNYDYESLAENHPNPT